MRAIAKEWRMTMDNNLVPVYSARRARMRVDREPTVTLEVTFDCDVEFANAFVDFLRGRGVILPDVAGSPPTAGIRELPSGAPKLPPAPVDGVFDDEDRGDDGE